MQQCNGWVLQYASDEMKNDREVVLAAAVQQDVSALKHAGADLKKDKEFVLAAVQRMVWH